MEQAFGSRLDHLARLLVAATVSGVDHRVNRLAAAITFYVLLSLFPAIFILVSLLGFLPQSVVNDAQRTIQEALASLFDSNVERFSDVLDELFQRNTGLLTVSSLAAAWTTSSSMNVLVESLHHIEGLEEGASPIAARVSAIGLAVASVAYAAAVVTLVVILPDLAVLNYVIGGGAFLVWLVGVYRLAGDRDLGWADRLPGAIAATLLALVLSAGFGAYISLGKMFGSLLVTVGGGLVIILWLYLVAIAILMGAEVNRTTRAPELPGYDTILAPLVTNPQVTRARSLVRRPRP